MTGHDDSATNIVVVIIIIIIKYSGPVTLSRDREVA